MKTTLYTAAVCLALAAPAVSLLRTAQDTEAERVDATEEALAQIFETVDTAPETAQDPVADLIDRMREVEAQSADRADAVERVKRAIEGEHDGSQVTEQDKDKTRAELEESIRRFQAARGLRRRARDGEGEALRADVMKVNQTRLLQLEAQLAAKQNLLAEKTAQQALAQAQRAEEIARVKQAQASVLALSQELTQSGYTALHPRYKELQRQIAELTDRTAQRDLYAQGAYEKAVLAEKFAVEQAQRDADVKARGYEEARSDYTRARQDLTVERDRRAEIKEQLARTRERLDRTMAEHETLAREYKVQAQRKNAQDERARARSGRNDDERLHEEIRRRLQRLEQRIERLEQSKNTQPSRRTGLMAPHLVAPKLVAPNVRAPKVKAPKVRTPKIKAPKAPKRPKAPKAAKIKAPKPVKAPKASTSRSSSVDPLSSPSRTASRYYRLRSPESVDFTVTAPESTEYILDTSVSDPEGSFVIDHPVSGRVVNEKGEPVQGVVVRVGNELMETTIPPGGYTLSTVVSADATDDEQALLREILDLVEGLKSDMNGLRKDVRKLRGEFTDSGAR